MRGAVCTSFPVRLHGRTLAGDWSGSYPEVLAIRLGEVRCFVAVRCFKWVFFNCPFSEIKCAGGWQLIFRFRLCYSGSFIKHMLGDIKCWVTSGLVRTTSVHVPFGTQEGVWLVVRFFVFDRFFREFHCTSGLFQRKWLLGEGCFVTNFRSTGFGWLWGRVVRFFDVLLCRLYVLLDMYIGLQVNGCLLAEAVGRNR